MAKVQKEVDVVKSKETTEKINEDIKEPKKVEAIEEEASVADEGYLLATEIYDDDSPKSSTKFATHSYDANGYETEISVWFDDDNNLALDDDEIYYIEYFTYDDSGNMLSKNYDFNGDESIDISYTYTYDEHNNILRESRDTNGDGNADRIYTYTYDSNNNMLSENYDYNGDGNVDQIITYTYDSNDNMLSESRDNNMDEIADEIYTYTYD
ncbi:MAG: hypothetical protein P8Y35_01110, partial [Sulfurovaceae bacterium]